jgi:ATP-binding protein involved in chromosome partitioning
MFQNADVPVLGVVQNMHGFICPHCGERIDIFPPSSEQRTQLDNLPLLGTIPLDPAMVTSGDRGQPAVVSLPESAVATAFFSIAHQIANTLEIEHSAKETDTTNGKEEIDERED